MHRLEIVVHIYYPKAKYGLELICILNMVMISRSFTDQRWSYIYIQARDGFKPIYRIQIISHASIDSSTNQIRSHNHLQSRQSFTLIYWCVMKSNPSADQRCFHIYLQLRDGIKFITDELRCSCTHQQSNKDNLTFIYRLLVVLHSSTSQRSSLPSTHYRQYRTHQQPRNNLTFIYQV